MTIGDIDGRKRGQVDELPGTGSMRLVDDKDEFSINCAEIGNSFITAITWYHGVAMR